MWKSKKYMFFFCEVKTIFVFFFWNPFFVCLSIEDFIIGDVVECRLRVNPKIWKRGIITSLEPLKVKPENHKRSFKCVEVRRASKLKVINFCFVFCNYLDSQIVWRKKSKIMGFGHVKAKIRLVQILWCLCTLEDFFARAHNLAFGTTSEISKVSNFYFRTCKNEIFFFI